MNDISDKKIGLIAGGGDFPLMLAKEARGLGFQVYVAGLKDITPKEIGQYASSCEYFRLGQVSAPIEYMRKAGVKKVVMAGKVPHVSIFGGILPDLRAAKLLFTLKDKKAASILGALADELYKDGLELINSATFLEHLLPKPGLLCGRQPDKNTMESVDLGWKAAKTISGLDIGLTVVVRDKAVIAVEAMEGTDECIKRSGEVLSGADPKAKKPFHGLAVVKVARPDQDMRFDLPVAGVRTLESMKAAGAEVLAVEAHKTLILDMPSFLAKAGEYGITVLALTP